MLSYEPLWKTMEEKNISTYTLIFKYEISSRTIYNLKHNKSITMYTLERICKILNCTPNDVVEFIYDEEETT
ncbi:MAG: helix-turn-helix transcriptional regulator [Lachnospiraceae bacterium]|nr:helix-turn-helix transcriptional regulator [Lachnospiraceae bacterium]